MLGQRAHTTGRTPRPSLGRAASWTAPAVVLALLLVPAAAPAARLTTLVRGVGAGSDKAAALTGHYVRELLGKDERYEVVDLAKALGNQDRDRALRAFGTAEEMVQKGRDAYDALELDAAVDFLVNALAKYERYAAYVGDFKKVAEALMLLGATHVLRGEEKQGSRRLEQALNVFPQVEPDPRVFNPAMRSLFQETVVRVNGRAAGTLSVTSNPGYAEVYVDGKFAGVTPTAVEKVSEGRHYVRLERDGYRAWGKVVEITGRSETAESAVLNPTTRFEEFDAVAESAIKRLTPPAKIGKDGGPSNEAIDKLGNLTSADLILLAHVRLDGEHVQVWANLYDLNGQRLLRGAEHGFTYEARADSYEREVAVMLHNNFGTTMPENLLIRDRREPREARERRGEARGRGDGDAPAAEAGGLPLAGQGRCVFGWPCKTFRTAALVVGTAVGGAAMLAGGIQWYLAGSTHDQWRKTPQIDANSADLSRRGRALAAGGDACFGIGLALAVVGSSIAIWYEPSPSAAEVVEAGGHSAQLFAVPTDGGGLAAARLNF